MAVPLILDCDPGLDDAMAILLAAGSPAVDLLAITTVGGNGDLADVTDNALRIASLAGLAIPVAAGEDRPLAGDDPLRALHIHGPKALGGPPLPAPTVALDGRHAVRLLRDVLLEASAPVVLAPVGPLTNIALLLRDHPEVRPRIAEIVLMGGARGRGNVRPYAEFNILVDPEAAALVFASGLPLRMLGLDLTWQARADAAVRARLRAIGTPAGDAAAGWMDAYADAYRSRYGADAPAVHDPCAVAAVIDRSLVSWDEAFVAVETEGRYTRGATVVDLAGAFGEPTNAYVGAELDEDAFWDLVIASISNIRNH